MNPVFLKHKRLFVLYDMGISVPAPYDTIYPEMIEYFKVCEVVRLNDTKGKENVCYINNKGVILYSTKTELINFKQQEGTALMVNWKFVEHLTKKYPVVEKIEYINIVERIIKDIHKLKYIAYVNFTREHRMMVHFDFLDSKYYLFKKSKNLAF